MKIRINDEWGIKSDEFQYHLCEIIKRKKKENGEIVKDNEGNTVYEEYFKNVASGMTKLGQVFDEYIRYKVRTEKDITEFKQVVELEKELLEEIKEVKEKLVN